MTRDSELAESTEPRMRATGKPKTSESQARMSKLTSGDPGAGFMVGVLEARSLTGMYGVAASAIVHDTAHHVRGAIHQPRVHAGQVFAENAQREQLRARE